MSLDRTTLVAGVAVTAAGVVGLLDQLESIDLRLGYGAPLLIAVLGAILLAAGLEGPRERD